MDNDAKNLLRGIDHCDYFVGGGAGCEIGGVKAIFAVTVLAFLAYPAFAREKVDVLVMKNGDRFTCEVKRLEGGVLEVELDYVDGTVSIDWLKVARLESRALFLVQLQDGSIYSGKVISLETLPGTPVKMEIQPERPQEYREVDQSQVVRITQTSESPLERFNGSITMGSLYSKGNSATQYSIGSELGYLQTRWAARVHYDSNLSSSTGAETSTRNQLDLTAYRLFRREKYFYGGVAAFLQSSVQGIKLQSNLGIVLGMFLKNTNRVRFSVLGGLGWQRSNYVQSSTTQNPQDISVAIFSSSLEAFRFKKTRLELNGSVVPALTDPGRIFSKTNLSYYVKMFGKVDWNLSFYGNWDTRPPPHFEGVDYGSSTGLSWTFGNK